MIKQKPVTYKESDKILKAPKDCKPVTDNLPNKQKVKEYYRGHKVM